jgi:hypothetical protein
MRGNLSRGGHLVQLVIANILALRLARKMHRLSCGCVLRAMCLFTRDCSQIMINNMLFKIARVLIVLPPLALSALVSSCAQDSGQTNGGVSNAGLTDSARNTQNQYTNPGRPETYSADERGFEKPWPFGDLANNPQH